MAARREQSPFVVKLRDIPSEGWRQAVDLTDEWAKKALSEEPLEWKATEVRAQVSLHKVDRDVIAHGHIAAQLETACARCANPTSLRVAAPFDATFVPATHSDDATPEREMQPGEAELIAYVDEQVDLEPSLREQLILALPYAPLCRESCKGLCGRCGKELNEGPCSCPAEVIEPEVKPDRWAALRDIKL
jgi:uncharacterized protein